MHPYAADPGIVAVAHDSRRGLRSGDDHHAVDSAGDRLHVGITTIAVEALHVRVHREDVVPGALQPAIDQIAGGVLAVVARYSGNRDAPLREEIVHLGV
jgi:hypothetical protein